MFLVLVPSGAFAGSTYSMYRSIGATSAPNHTNPTGSMMINASGTNIAVSYENQNSINVTHNTRDEEPDAGDATFSRFNTFQIQTHGDNSMGFFITATFQDGSSYEYGGSSAGQGVAYDSTFSVDIGSLINTHLRQNFDVNIEFYWDNASDSDWRYDTPITYHFRYSADTVPPVVSEIGAAQQYSSVLTNTWNFNIVGAQQDVASATYQLQYSTDGSSFANDGQPVTVSSSQSSYSSYTPVLGSDGYYRVLVSATNEDNYASQPLTSSVYGLEAQNPTFSANPTASFTPDGSGNLLVSWTAAGDTLGLQSNPYTVSYSQDGGNSFIVFSSAQAQTSATLPFSTLFYGQTIEFTVKATNRAGNSTSVTSNAVIVPPQLTLNARFNQVVNLGTEQDMEVDLQFNLTPSQLRQSFTGIVIARLQQSGASNPSITLSKLSIDTSTINIDSNGNFVPSSTWNVQGNDIYYIDLISISSGAGHKSWVYSATPSPWVGPPVPASPAVTLPNNQGSASLTMIDMAGNPYDPNNPSAFQVGADRKIQVQFQGSDPDQDHWQFELDRITQKQTPNATLQVPVRLSGNSEIDYPNPYAARTITVTLNPGLNNVGAFWSEQGDPAGSAQTFESGIKSVTLTPKPSGGYQVVITDANANDLPTDNSGIVTSPGEPLNFSISPSGASGTSLTYSWDFNDGTTAGNVTSVTHAFSQKPDQTTDSCQYNMVISIDDGTTVTPIDLVVIVQDTQEGALYTNEVWNGDHQVLGVVEIPAGLSLTISPNENVSFVGGLATDFQQGLLVDPSGRLTVGGSVFFHKISGQTNGWGTIQVMGQAAIGAADITDADRGVTVGPQASVTLTGTNIHQNLIGLHVVGNVVTNTTGTTVDGVTFAGNTVYGIKEDYADGAAPGRPQVTNSIFSSNLHDYYTADTGPVSIDYLNGLPGNGSNVEKTGN